MRLAHFLLAFVLASLVTVRLAFAESEPPEIAQASQPRLAESVAEIAQLKRMADHGDAPSQLRIGVLYAKAGKYSDAAHYYKLAADRGLPEAQYHLASLNCTGLGMAKNNDECTRLYRLAANGGEVQAQINLAARALTGDGMPRDYAEAARLAKMAADGGNAMGRFLLGMCFELGAGVPKDRAQAVRLYEQSAAQGNTSAQNALARLSGKPINVTPTVAVSTLAVPMVQVNGIFVVPVRLNDAIDTNFVVDSGASNVSIPENIVEALRRAGKIAESDFTGVATMRVASGATMQSRTFVLRSLAIKGRLLQNVAASTSPTGSVPLLGQTFLQRFSSWSIDNERRLLVLKEREVTSR